MNPGRGLVADARREGNAAAECGGAPDADLGCRSPTQLALDLRIPGSASLENFIPGPNDLALDLAVSAAAGAGEQFLYLWGATGTGKTHLLQAVCREVSLRGQSVAYVPLDRTEWLAPAVLEGLEGLGLLALDGLDAVAGLADWEEGLFHLYNRIRERGGRVLFGARTGPAELPVGLADLRSRLAAALVVRLRPLDDTGRAQALQTRAAERGFVLPAPAARYLVRRVPRDMHSLTALLEHLDRASLLAQRSLTLPFLRELLRARPVRSAREP